MSHHLKTSGTDRIENLGAFLEIGDLELLLQEN